MSGSGVKSDAFSNSGNALNLSNQLQGNAANIYGSVEPTLAAEAAHPQGYSPTDLAMLNTSAQQSAGGSQAGAVGQGALLASRTKNAGTADAAIAKSAENAGGLLSKAALGTQEANANLKQKQQQEGLSGMQSLYGTDLSGGENALGLSNSALDIANNAKPGFWQQMATTAGENLVNAGMDSAEARLGF